MKLFLALSPEQATRRFGVAPAPIDRERYDLLARYHSAAWAASGVYQPLIDLRAAGNTALYAYRFDWDSMKRSWIVDLPQLLGAAHGLELDFLFRPVLAPQVPGVIHRGNRSGAERLGQSMRDYWAGFAYAGRPGSGRSGGRSAWPRWRSDEPRVMILDADDDGGIRSEQIAPLLVDDLKRELAAELQLPQRLRCALYVDLFLANNGLPELFDAREYRELGCAPFPSGSVRGLSR
jgi:para-nitrobenzyl esterase